MARSAHPVQLSELFDSVGTEPAEKSFIESELIYMTRQGGQMRRMPRPRTRGTGASFRKVRRSPGENVVKAEKSGERREAESDPRDLIALILIHAPGKFFPSPLYCG